MIYLSGISVVVYFLGKHRKYSNQEIKKKLTDFSFCSNQNSYEDIFVYQMHENSPMM